MRVRPMNSSWLNEFEVKRDDKDRERIDDILTYPVVVTVETPPHILKLLLDAAIARQYIPKSEK